MEVVQHTFLGFTNFSNKGVSGVEKEFDEELKGKDGKVFF